MDPYNTYPKQRKVFETFRLIKSGEVKTKTELADILEVDERTVFNYLKELRNVWEVDVNYDEEKEKFIIEHDGILGMLKYTNPLTAEDVNLILASLVQSNAFMETRMKIIQNSLLNILPDREAQVLKRTVFTEKPCANDQHIFNHIGIIRKAMMENSKVTLRYISGSGERKVLKAVPYSFAYDIGKYYLIAQIDGEDKLRHFRIDRIKEVKILEEQSKCLERFNVEQYLKRTWYMYAGEETKILVKFKNCAYTVVTERNMADGSLVERNEDHFTYEFISNGTNGIKLWLLGFGADAEVLEPIELRNEMKEIITEMMSNYR